jgi:hypothetical protein
MPTIEPVRVLRTQPLSYESRPVAADQGPVEVLFRPSGAYEDPVSTGGRILDPWQISS